MPYNDHVKILTFGRCTYLTKTGRRCRSKSFIPTAVTAASTSLPRRPKTISSCCSPTRLFVSAIPRHP